MRGRGMTALLASFALAFACSCVPALAEPSASEIALDEEAYETGALTDRFELLDKLGNSLTDEEGVVIATRVGVLVSINRALNDNQVSFEGEAVGDLVNAGDGHRWANVMGTSNAVISVFLTDEQASLIHDVGDYHSTGTTLKITGTYHIACPEHQGELDVHASKAEVVNAGAHTPHPVVPGRLEAALVVCFMAAAALVVYYLSRRYIGKRADE